MVYYVYLICSCVYFAVYGFYLWEVIKNALRAGPRSHRQRFSAESIIMISFLSMSSVLLAAFPTKQRTLRFVMQNGIINLYMFLMSYFFEPYSADDFSYEVEDEFHTSSTNSSQERSYRQSSCDSSPSRQINSDNLNESVQMTERQFSDSWKCK